MVVAHAEQFLFFFIAVVPVTCSHSLLVRTYPTPPFLVAALPVVDYFLSSLFFLLLFSPFAQTKCVTSRVFKRCTPACMFAYHDNSILSGRDAIVYK